MACLKELWKQQVIDQKVYDQMLMEVMDGDTMIHMITGEVLDPDVDSTHWKDKF